MLQVSETEVSVRLRRTAAVRLPTPRTNL